MDNGHILNSWKEIARYLGRGVRTCQRWERDLNLPVRRPRNRTRSAVMALPGELDAWVASRPTCRVQNEKCGEVENNVELLRKKLRELQEQERIVEEQLANLERRKPRLVKGHAAGLAG